jgi:hypothetical protein
LDADRCRVIPAAHEVAELVRQLNREVNRPVMLFAEQDQIREGVVPALGSELAVVDMPADLTDPAAPGYAPELVPFPDGPADSGRDRLQPFVARPENGHGCCPFCADPGQR